MKQMIKQNWLTTAALLWSLPAGYFIMANILNEFGIPGPYNLIDSFVERSGGREPLGWNINLLILLGPVAGFLLALFQVLQIKWQFGKAQFDLHFSIRMHWFPILVAGFSISLLAFIFFYLTAENCFC